MSAGSGTLPKTAGNASPEARSGAHRAAIPGFKPRAEDALAHLLARIPAIALLVGAGVVSTVIYVLFVVAFPITRWWNHPHQANNPNAINDLGQITHYSPLTAAAFVSAVLALFACQFLAVSAMRRPGQQSRQWLRRLAMGFPLAFIGVLIWMQPVTTTDLYGYVARGYLYAHLHFNPMTTPAFLLPQGLLVSRPPAPYGPLWLLICGAFSLLAGEHLLLNMLMFKLVGAAGVIVGLLLVRVLAFRLFPGSVATIVMFLAWNPLLLFEAVGNGHNDIIMMDCVLAALVLMMHRYARSALALLVLGALIKYVAAILIPLWLIYELAQRRADRGRPTVATSTVAPTSPEQRPRRHPAKVSFSEPITHASFPTVRPPLSPSSMVATFVHGARATLGAVAEIDRRAALELIVGGGAIATLLVAGCYLPFWDGLRTFTGLGHQIQPLYYNGSLVQFIAAPLELFVSPHDYTALDMTVRLVFYAIFIGYAWIQTYRLWQAGTEVTMQQLITAGAKVIFAALILIAFWYQPWYVVWLLPLAAISDDPFVRSRAVILSAGSLLTYAVGNYLFVHETGIGQSLFVQFFEVMVAFLPLLLLRGAPGERNWEAIVRSYLGLLGEGLRQRTSLWDRVMLGLILVVAVLLRLVRLGNLFTAIDPESVSANVLRQLNGDLNLILTDPHGLEGPFALLQRAMVAVFGLRPFALLVPSALIGSATVWLIYLVTTSLLSDGSPVRARSIGLLAALLAATSTWHVSLSRSGVQVVALPFLMCLALYLLMLALRMPPSQRVGRPARTSRRRAARSAVKLSPVDRLRTLRRVLLFAGSGMAAGLGSDLAPGLWLLPLMLVGVLILVRWQRADWLRDAQSGLGALAAGTLVAALPGIWHYWFSRSIGFPQSSTALAQSGAVTHTSPSVLSPAFLSQVIGNAGSVLHVLTAQDYSASWPSSGGTPIMPGVIWVFFYLGIAIVLWRWRRFSSLLLLLLLALPMIASISVGTEPSIIQAASVLPAACIVPALALYEAGSLLGRLPIAFDRAHGARVFANPEQIGRVLLMAFLLVSTVRTFYWYFEATLPSTPPNTTVAS
jgi:4-amino-4-deoxy-L-arabinose transferase-like glycosyltransferase